MALGVSRLLLSLSVMKRFTRSGDFLLTQFGDFFLSQEGRNILANQSSFSTADDPDVTSQPVTFLLTQDGGSVLVTEDDRGIGAEQALYDFKSEFDQIMMTQQFELITTQDGNFLVYPIPNIIDILLTQDGLSLTDQNNDLISLQANRSVASLGAEANRNIQLITQDGLVLITNQELDAA